MPLRLAVIAQLCTVCQISLLNFVPVMKIPSGEERSTQLPWLGAPKEEMAAGACSEEGGGSACSSTQEGLVSAGFFRKHEVRAVQMFLKFSKW